jgi:hypothetical protein
VVLLRKSIPQNRNLKSAAELNVIKEGMKKHHILLGLASISVGFAAGFVVGWQQSAERVSKNVAEAFFLTNAYAYSIGLSAEIGMHELIKSGNLEAAKNFALYKIDSSVKQIEKINYGNSAFRPEIESSLSKAKAYLKEHQFVLIK